jgi:hypothetical protein
MSHSADELLWVLLKDDVVMRTALQRQPLLYEYASETLRADRSVALDVFRESGEYLEYAAAELRDDAAVLRVAIRSFPRAFEYASARCKADRDLVLYAVEQDGEQLRHASEALRADRDVVLAAIKSNVDAIQHVCAGLRSDREVALTAVSLNGNALRSVSPLLQSDREIVLEAVSDDGSALKYASLELRNDPEVVFAAVARGPACPFAFASIELRKDLAFVRRVVAVNARAIQDAVWPLGGADRDTVLLAIRQDLNVITCRCTWQWRADKEIILMVLKEKPWLLWVASEEMLDDREVLLQSMRRGYDKSMMYASPRLRADPLVLSWAVLTRGECLWRSCREVVKGRAAAWYWLEAVAKSKEEHRIKRAKLGHVWEEEGEGDLLGGATAQ